MYYFDYGVLDFSTSASIQWVVWQILISFFSTFTRICNNRLWCCYIWRKTEEFWCDLFYCWNIRPISRVTFNLRNIKSTFLQRLIILINRGNNVKLVLCVLLGHQNSKIANSMKLVNFALFSSQYHVFELKNIRGNLIAPNSNRWSLSNKIAMSQEDNRKIISLFGQEKSIFLHPWMLKDLM